MTSPKQRHATRRMETLSVLRQHLVDAGVRNNVTPQGVWKLCPAGCSESPVACRWSETTSRHKAYGNRAGLDPPVFVVGVRNNVTPQGVWKRVVAEGRAENGLVRN